MARRNSNSSLLRVGIPRSILTVFSGPYAEWYSVFIELRSVEKMRDFLLKINLAFLSERTANENDIVV